MKYPILVLTAAIALIAADPTPVPSPSSSPTAEFSPSAMVTPATSASPAATPTPSLDTLMGPHHGRYGGRGSSPDGRPKPAPDIRKGLDGVWELQIQRGPDTQYEHFNIKQTGNAITGTYLTTDKKKYPLTGTLDGTNLRLVVSLPDGSTILLEARVDGTTDMLGMLTDSKERVPFTAAYRPKERWSDNINATPGGLGIPTGGGPGGYGPP